MKKFLSSLFMALFAIVAFAGTSEKRAVITSPECKHWVDSVIKTMSLEDQVAQLFFVNLFPNPEANTTIKSLIGKYKMGGILFYRGELDDYVSAINCARESAEIQPFIAFDGEWGLQMRIKDTPRFPHNICMGAVQDYDIAYEYGKEVARELKAIGVNINFAPVVDVNLNPNNPVIGYRSFGENPENVAKYACSYADGLEDGGVMAVAKHFPGHGDTSADSHKELPVVTHDYKTLTNIDLLPFAKFIAHGGNGIMVGHLNVPALDKSCTPASLSYPITTELLKEKMGFDGIIFTDALGMRGARLVGKSNCVEALKAGADVLLNPEMPVQDFKQVVKAVKKNVISKKDIEMRCRKVLAYKYAFGVQDCKPVRNEGIKEIIEAPQAYATAQKIANSAITLVQDKHNLIPVKDVKPKSIAIVNIGGNGAEFEEYCHKYADVDIYNTAYHTKALKKYDTVIAAVYKSNQSASHQLSTLKKLPNVIEVFFVNPYKISPMKGSISGGAAVIFAYDDTENLQSAAAQAIFGGIEIKGRCPVDIKGLIKSGEGLSREKNRLGYSSAVAEGLNGNLDNRLDSLITYAIDKGAFPGCQLLVAKNGNVIFDKAYGYQSFGSKYPVTNNTLYDLASVSKATGTLPGVMKAYDLGLFNLNDTASKYIPGLRSTNKSDVTIKQLLFHESGIQPSLNMFYLMMDSTTYTGKLIDNKPSDANPILIQEGAYGNATAQLRRDITSPVKTKQFNIEAAKGLYVGKITYDTIMSRIYNSPLRKDKSYAYSCLNFCLLMDLEQHVTGISHDKWIQDSVFNLLGCYRTCYQPLNRFKNTEIASTEKDTYMRKQTLCGYVHDELANFSGGVQGNAGLFSNAEDLAKLCQMWLFGGTYGGNRILSPETVKLFTTTKSPTCRRGLGFDKPDKTNSNYSPTCAEATAGTYGHLGFTGTVFWVDPENDIIFIFLCNRVNPTRDNEAFDEVNIRPRLFQMVYQAMKK